MDQLEYVAWLSQSDRLTERQRHHAHRTLGPQSVAEASVAVVEQGVGEDRRCRHCQTPGAVRNGKGRGGLQRYRCKACRRTFTALTGTPLSGLHYKKRWLAVGDALARRESVRAMAKRCRVHVSTAFRWRHRFLAAVGPSPDRLAGIVEVDETFVRTSEKGARNLDRPPRRRGQPAGQPGRSKDQAAVLMAADRGGATCSHVLPEVTAAALAHELRNWVQSDALLVSDGHRAYPPCARALGLRHEAINLSAGVRVRGAYHIQTVNNRHGQLKEFLRPFRGVSTKYLDNYLHWLHLTALAKQSSPRTCLATAIGRSSTRFAN